MNIHTSIIKVVLIFCVAVILSIGLFGCESGAKTNFNSTSNDNEIDILRLPPCERYVDFSMDSRAFKPYIVTKNDCSKPPSEYMIIQYDKPVFGENITVDTIWFKIIEQ